MRATVLFGAAGRQRGRDEEQAAGAGKKPRVKAATDGRRAGVAIRKHVAGVRTAAETKMRRVNCMLGPGQE